MSFAGKIPGEQTEVCLVLMPFASTVHASIALGLLKSSLQGTDISCSTIYANLLFAEMIGLDPYRMVECCSWFMIGDWIFAGKAFENHSFDEQAYLEQVAQHCLTMIPNGRSITGRTKQLTRVFHSLRKQAGVFVDLLANLILDKNPRVVGCSSTFQQHVASLALLRRIKETAPSIVTIIGGGNCEGEMGAATLRFFPWVDLVFSGEADDTFHHLCCLMLHYGKRVPPDLLPDGAISRERVIHSGEGPHENPLYHSISELDNAPVPDYDDYFFTLRKLSLGKRVRPGLMMETSRGCWWSQRRGCRFCGFHRKEKGFRTKSPERAISELKFLTEKYHLYNVEMTDSSMDPAYFETFLPRLGKLNRSYRIHYVLRPNLTRNQVKILKDAGVTWVQIGIEALHDELLRIMNKGTTAISNVQALRSISEFGLHVIWHLLRHLPGEEDHWYHENAIWLPLVHHLPAPSGFLYVNFPRFSEYRLQRKRYQLTLTPLRYYKYIYPLDVGALEDLAYFFEPPPEFYAEKPGIAALREAVNEWRKAKMARIPPLLCMTDKGDQIKIYDTRACAPERRTCLRGLHAQIYRICDRAVDRARAARLIQHATTWRPSMETIDRVVEELKERKLLLELGGKLLSLAVPGDVPEPPSSFHYPGGYAPRPSWDGILGNSGEPEIRQI